jgi:hypothetical protein
MQMEINMDNHQVTFWWWYNVLSPSNGTSPHEVHWSSTSVHSEDEDSFSGDSNSDVTFFRQTHLSFKFDFGLTGSELSLVEI